MTVIRKSVVCVAIHLTCLLAMGSVFAQQQDDIDRSAAQALSLQSVERINSMLLSEYLRRLDELSKRFEELANTADQMQTALKSLYTSDLGKRLATRTDAVRAFIAYEQDPSVTAEEIELHSARLEPIRQGIAQQATVASIFDATKSPEVKHLAEEELWIATQSRQLATRKARIQALIKLAPKGTDVASLPTLQRQVESVITRMMQEEIVATEKAREEGRQTSVSEIAEAAKLRELEQGKQKVENELRLMQLEVQKLQEEKRLLEAKKVAEIQAVEHQVKKTEKETMLEDPKILSKLRPFTASGYWQPGDQSRGASLDKVPMSFDKIQSFGALNDGHQGLALLLAVANQGGMDRSPNSGVQFRTPATYSGFNVTKRKHIDTDRPKWAYPRFFDQLSVEQLIEVREVQRLLIELGPVMVEQKLLAP